MNSKLLLTILLVSCIKNMALGSSGANFLKLGVGARAVGLGNAYTAIVNDATALYWNPAGLSQLAKREFSAMHAELFSDTRLDFIGYAHPLTTATESKKAIKTGSKNIDQYKEIEKNGKTFFGVGAVYLSQGGIEGRTVDRGHSSDFSANDLAITLGGSKFLNEQTSLGLNVKLLQSKIAGFSSTGFAFDVGSFHRFISPSLHRFSLGFAIQNIGPKMKFVNETFDLPLTLASGVALPLASYRLPLTFSADLKHQPYDSKASLSVGAEFSPVSMISFRAGYLITSSSPTKGREIANESLSNLFGLGAGIGFNLGSSTIDYSFTPAGELGNNQRLSLSLKF